MKIKAQSGFKWDDEHGADIDETTAEVWAAFEKKHKGSTPFCNKGWIWLKTVQPLMPTTPRGANAYRASQGTQLPAGESQKLEADLAPETQAETQDSDRPLSNWLPLPPPEERHPVAQAAPPSSDNVDNNDISAPVKTQTPAAGLKCKHSALSSSSDNNSSIKRPRPSGAVALHTMNDRLEEFTNVFREVFAVKTGLPSTPQRKAKAIQLAQDDIFA
ncbi:hypothetical protein B0H34DRAFT_825111 [Crassisporium funariophilum]|nr:hypothetical protein B0H34DRAFT_825111 [Crassisporium funariophilum]